MVGAVIVSLGQTGLIVWLDRKNNSSTSSTPSTTRKRVNPSVENKHETSSLNVDTASNLPASESNHLDPGYDVVAFNKARRTRQSLAWPVLLTGSVAMSFAVRGAWLNPNSFWIYIGVIAILAVLTTIVGWMLSDGKLSFVSAAVASVGVSIVVWKDPAGWFSGDRPDWMNLIAIALALISAAWVAFYIVQTQHSKPNTQPRHPSSDFPRSFLWLPNIVMLGGPIWVLILALLQFIGRSTSGSFGLLDNPLSITTLLAMMGLAGTFFWNDRAKFIVFAWCAFSLALAIAIPSITTESPRPAKTIDERNRPRLRVCG